MKLIKLNTDHYIIVDDSEIKEGDWIYNSEREPSILECVGKGSLRDWQKITHSTNIDWNDVYYIHLQEVKELIGEVDAEKKAMEIHPVELDEGWDKNKQYRDEWVNGYTQALEDNKEKKYTEEDIRKAWRAAYIDAISIDEETYKPLFFEDFIQSLQPKTEWDVEIVDGKLKLK